MCLAFAACASGPRSHPQRESSTAGGYELAVTILPETRRLAVTGTWSVPPRPAPRDSVTFQLSSLMEDVRVRFSGPADLEPSVTTHDAETGDRRYTVRPARPIAPGEAVTLTFIYVSDTVPAPQFRIGPGASFAGGAGELWYPQEDFSTRDVGTLWFQVPSSYTVVAPGVSARERNGRFRFDVTTPVKFAFAAGPYRVFERPGDPALRLLLLRDRPGADAVLDSVATAAETLRRWFGPAPFPSLAIVEVEFGSAVIGTSEHGFILADARQLDREFELPYWAHELGHQWWGVRVRTRGGTRGRMLMSEGLAEFGALLAIGALEGDTAAEAYRRGTYPGRVGRTTTEYFRLAAAGLELPVAADPGRQTTLMHRMANTRGFLLLDQLAEMVGRERFSTLLAQFAADHGTQPASYDEFRDAVRRGAPPDVDGVFDQWFERTGAPEYHVEWRAASREVRGVVRQGRPAYDADIEIAVYGPGRRETHELPVRGVETPFAVPAPFPVDSVILDPAYRVLRWTPTIRAEARALAPYTRAEWERRYGEPDSAIAAFQVALGALDSRAPDPHGLRFLLEYGLGRALSDAGVPADARRHLETAVSARPTRAETLPLVWTAIARVARQLGEEDYVEHALQQALVADRAAGGRTGALAEVAAIRSQR